MSVTVSCEEGGRYRQRDERERVAASGSVRSVAEPLKQRKDYLFSPLLADAAGRARSLLLPRFPPGGSGRGRLNERGAGGA